MISYNLMWNRSYLIFILNNYRYDNYLNSNRYNKLNNYRYDNYLNFNRYNKLKGHICNFLQVIIRVLIKIFSAFSRLVQKIEKPHHW
jgi:hypothetical protein